MVAALTGAQAFGSLMTLVLPSIAPAVAQDYGVPVYLIGYQVSLMYTGLMLALVFGTNLNIRWGACRVIQTGLGLLALGAALTTTRSLLILVPASLAMGIGYGLLTPASSHILIRFTPEKNRNTVFSLKQSGVPAGGVLAATAGPAMTVFAGWQSALWLFAALLCAMALLLQAGRKGWDDDRKASAPLAANPLATISVIWRLPSLRLVSIAGACLAAGQSIIQNYTVAMFYEELAMPLVQAGLILTVAQLGGVVGRLFWGWLADYSRDCQSVLTILAGSLAATALASMSLGYGWPMAATLALFFLLGATASGWSGAFLGEVARLAPAGQVSAATGGSLLLAGATTIVTPVVFASLYMALRSYSLSFGLLVLPSVAAVCLLRAARRPSRAASP